MECFMQEQVDNKKFPLLSNRVWYYKNEEGGMNTMCKIVEDYANEMMLDSIKALFENGCNLDMAIASFKNIPEELIRKLYEEVMRNKALV